MCGENVKLPASKSRISGSSPRVRGKLLPSRCVAPRRRLIPACAGKTYALHCGRRWTGAHPRVCGENNMFLKVLVWTGGSSPRVRGKQALVEVKTAMAGLIPACAGKTVYTAPAYYTTGLIPACAGKTLYEGALPPDAPAHPRVCGENSAISRGMSTEAGSSPRVRGKRSRGEIARRRRRLIPACAGKTRADSTHAY